MERDTSMPCKTSKQSMLRVYRPVNIPSLMPGSRHSKLISNWRGFVNAVGLLRTVTPVMLMIIVTRKERG